MEETRSREVDPRLFTSTIARHDAFTEALGEYQMTLSMPSPPDPSPAWSAWDVACGESYSALVAAIDHYCAKRVLSAVFAVQMGSTGIRE